jgi:hypothetical protein
MIERAADNQLRAHAGALQFNTAVSACVRSLITHSHGKSGLAVPLLDVELVAVQCAIPHPLGGFQWMRCGVVSACACRARILGQSVRRVLCAMRDGTKRRRHDGRSMQGTCATASFVRSFVLCKASQGSMHMYLHTAAKKCRLRLWCSVACLSQLSRAGYWMATCVRAKRLLERQLCVQLRVSAGQRVCGHRCV